MYIAGAGAAPSLERRRLRDKRSIQTRKPATESRAEPHRQFQCYLLHIHENDSHHFVFRMFYVPYKVISVRFRTNIQTFILSVVAASEFPSIHYLFNIFLLNTMSRVWLSGFSHKRVFLQKYLFPPQAFRLL